MRPFFGLLPALLGCGFVVACGQNDTKSSPGAGPTVTGTVVDQGGQALADVFVSAYGATTSTGVSGEFGLSVSQLPKDRVVVGFQKSGFFDRTHGVRPAADGTVAMRVVLVARDPIGTLDNATGGGVTGPGLSLSAPPGAFRLADGSALVGAVTIFGAYIDPTSDPGQMPGGDFVATDETDQEGVLLSYGAALAEAETASGESASLGDSADLCVAIPASLRASAPQEMAVWILNRQSGVWKPAGTAQRVGDEYCFQTSELGAINCDIFGRSAIVTGRVCSQGRGVAGTGVKVQQLVTTTGPGGGYSILVPANQAFRLESDAGSADVCGLTASQQVTVNLGDCPEGPGDGASDGGCVPAFPCAQDAALVAACTDRCAAIAKRIKDCNEPVAHDPSDCLQKCLTPEPAWSLVKDTTSSACDQWVECTKCTVELNVCLQSCNASTCDWGSCAGAPKPAYCK